MVSAMEIILRARNARRILLVVSRPQDIRAEAVFSQK